MRSMSSGMGASLPKPPSWPAGPRLSRHRKRAGGTGGGMTIQTAPLTFPPAMSGTEVGGDPFDGAVMQAIRGCDAGLICYRRAADRMGAALVFAPEVPLSQAMA